MAIVNRHIAQHPPHYGLSPFVVNIPQVWVGHPGIASSNNVATKTQQTGGSSIAAGTAIDYPRNVVVYITPSASSAGVSGGGVTIYGKDAYGSTRSETFNSLAASSSVGQSGSVNFAKIDTISMKLTFHVSTSSAASDYAVVVGRGNKLGLPVSLRSSDAVFDVHLGTLGYSTYSGATSSDNQYTVVTGDYWNNGVQISNGYSSASLAQIAYNNLGYRAPVFPD